MNNILLNILIILSYYKYKIMYNNKYYKNKKIIFYLVAIYDN